MLLTFSEMIYFMSPVKYRLFLLPPLLLPSLLGSDPRLTLTCNCILSSRSCYCCSVSKMLTLLNKFSIQPLYNYNACYTCYCYIAIAILRLRLRPALLFQPSVFPYYNLQLLPTTTTGTYYLNSITAVCRACCNAYFTPNILF